MFKSLYLFVIATAAVGVNIVRAAPAGADVSVVGTTTVNTPLGPMTPDISVVGYHSIAGTTGTVVGAVTPDVSVMGAWTTSAAAATRTECYRVVETGGVTSSVPAVATVTGGVNPPGYECFLIYATGGGIVHLPVSDAMAPSSAQAPNLAITVGLPIIISLVGLAAIVGAVFVFLRLRARRAAAAQRTWVDRPGGWVGDNQVGKMESGAERY